MNIIKKKKVLSIKNRPLVNFIYTDVKIRYKNLPPREISARFFIIMFASFFIETHPDSSIPNPKRKHMY